jgi:hypothetical protein
MKAGDRRPIHLCVDLSGRSIARSAPRWYAIHARLTAVVRPLRVAQAVSLQGSGNIPIVPGLSRTHVLCGSMLMAAVGLSAQSDGVPGSVAGDGPASRTNEGLALQVALDRAGFSPGVLDGRPGRLTRAALDASKAAAAALPAVPPMLEYSLTPDDLAGPWVVIPDRSVGKCSGNAAMLRCRDARRFEARGSRLRAKGKGPPGVVPGGPLRVQRSAFFVRRS